MNERPPLDMVELFNAVLHALKTQQTRLNQADAINGNHGDHMVAIFDIAVKAAASLQVRRPGWTPASTEAAAQTEDLSAALQQASRLLDGLKDNGSATVYSSGLALLAHRFQERSLELADLVAYAGSILRAKPDQSEASLPASGRDLEVVKALLDALADWERREANRDQAAPGQQAQTGSDLGYLFGAGMVYLQARQKGGDRLDVLTETAVNASPLGRVSHRAESGRIVIRSLLQSLAGSLLGRTG